MTINSIQFNTEHIVHTKIKAKFLSWNFVFCVWGSQSHPVRIPESTVQAPIKGRGHAQILENPKKTLSITFAIICFTWTGQASNVRVCLFFAWKAKYLLFTAYSASSYRFADLFISSFYFLFFIIHVYLHTSVLLKTERHR